MKCGHRTYDKTMNWTKNVHGNGLKRVLHAAFVQEHEKMTNCSIASKIPKLITLRRLTNASYHFFLNLWISFGFGLKLESFIEHVRAKWELYWTSVGGQCCGEILFFELQLHNIYDSIDTSTFGMGFSYGIELIRDRQYPFCIWTQLFGQSSQMKRTLARIYSSRISHHFLTQWALTFCLALLENRRTRTKIKFLHMLNAEKGVWICIFA